MRRALRTKWRWVGWFWLFQAVAAYGLWPILAEKVPWKVDAADLVRGYLDARYASWTVIVVLCAMILQAAFLMPVRRPRASGGSALARLVHQGISGAAVSVLVGLVGLLVLALLVATAEVFQIHIVDSDIPPQLFFWAPALLAWPVVTACLAVYCRRGTPVWISMVIAGLCAGLLLGGVVLAVWSLVNLLKSTSGRDSPWLLAAAMVAAISWAISTPLLISFCRNKPPESALSRVASRLLIGTIIEAAAVIPLDVMARRKTDCYCAEGTLWSLTISWAVGLLVLGPAVWLLPLSRRRRRWYRGRCIGCGYDVSACTGAERCPECGLGWRAAVETAAGAGLGHRS